LEAFCKTDDYRHVRSYLNVFELMAVGIENRTFDERICYVYWKGYVLDTMRETSKLIDHIRTRDNADLYFRSFRQLHYRWMTNRLLSVGSTEADHYGADLYLLLRRHSCKQSRERPRGFHLASGGAVQEERLVPA